MDEKVETDSAARLAIAAWDANSRRPRGNPLDTWRSQVANARSAVELMCRAERLTQADPSVEQDLVYLLDALAVVLLSFADETEGHIAEALSVAGEAVERQASIVAATIGRTGLAHPLVTEARETLTTVLETRSKAREFAGLPQAGIRARQRHLRAVPGRATADS